MNLQLQNLRTFAGYPNFDDAVMCRWRDIVYSFPSTKFTSKVDEALVRLYLSATVKHTFNLLI